MLLDLLNFTITRLKCPNKSVLEENIWFRGVEDLHHGRREMSPHARSNSAGLVNDFDEKIRVLKLVKEQAGAPECVGSSKQKRLIREHLELIPTHCEGCIFALR